MSDARAAVGAIVRRVGRDEAGFAMPMAILIVAVTLAVATAAIFGSIEAETGTSRDYQSKDAFAAAEAGVNEALLRYNGTDSGSGTSWGTCLPSGTPGAPINATSWCPAQSGSLPDGSQYSWQIGFPQQTPGAPAPPHTASIVSTGTVQATGAANGAVRRVEVSASSAAAQTPFFDAGIIGLDFIGVDSNSGLTGDTATNGDVTLASNTTLCGNVEVGPGRNVLPVGRTPACGGTITQGVTSLPPVNEGDVATNNNNSNFFTVNPVVSGQKSRACFGGRNATGATDTSCKARELVISRGGGGTWVTLNGGNYSFCRLELQQGTGLYIANGATVTIYFDSPENCPQSSFSVPQMLMEQNTAISATGGTAVNLALLFVGSDSIQTQIVMASNTSAPVTCNQDFVIYAPRTAVELRSNSYFCGAVAGKSIHIDSNTTIRASNAAQQFPLPGWVEHYAVDGFQECGPIPTGSTTPNAGC